MLQIIRKNREFITIFDPNIVIKILSKNLKQNLLEVYVKNKICRRYETKFIPLDKFIEGIKQRSFEPLNKKYTYYSDEPFEL